VPRCGVCFDSGPVPGRVPEKPPVGRASGGVEADVVRGPVEDDGAPEGEIDPRGRADPDGDEPGINR